MKNTRMLALSIAAIVVSASQISAQDLSRYREFHVGMSLAAVAARAEISPEARVLQQRPALIQELMWQPPRYLRSSPESLRKVLFSFYNGQLFRMVVTYDRDKTEGLTAGDMIDAISVTYGLPLLPSTHLVSPGAPAPDGSVTSAADERRSRGLDYEDTILARWGDAENSIYLFQAPYQKVFGLAVLSKPLDALARAAITEGARLDVQEAPQLEIERQQQQADEKRAKNDAARLVNKQTFRP